MGLVFVSLNVYARDPYFVRYPQLNQNVGNFMTAFVSNLAPEIKDSQVRFDFTEGKDGIKNTDMAYGQIQGTYQGIAQLPTQKESANITIDFRVNLEKAPKREGVQSAEYAINLRTDGYIDSTGNFMNFFMGILTPECIEDDYDKADGALGNICRAVVESKLDLSKSNVDNAFIILTFWKARLLEGLAKSQNPKMASIKNKFITYVDDRIHISQSGKVLNLSINLEDLSKDFRGEALAFLQETKLDDLSIKSLDVQMNESEIQFSAHVVKRHVVTSLNKYMELASTLTSIIESPQAGADLGKAIRDGRGVTRRDIVGQASVFDKASTALTAGMIKLRGSKNSDTGATTSNSDDDQVDMGW